MAYRRYSKRRVARRPARRSYSTKRSTGRKRSYRGGSNVLRIVLEQPAASVVTRPGEKPAAPPRTARF